MPQSTLRVQAYAMADEIGLSREDRIELAEMLLKRDVPSWKTLSEAQIQRLVDCMNGWAYVTALFEMRLQPYRSSTA